MWKTLDSELFGLLSEFSQTSTNDEMKNTYGCFVEHMKTVSQSKTDYSEI
jgi:hypothetical protein